MGNRKIDFSSEPDKQSSSGPKFVRMKCCAADCIFTQEVSSLDPKPFTCSYHQKVNKVYWPNVSRNIKQFKPFYDMGTYFVINRKFDKFTDTEPEMLTEWAQKHGVPHLAPRQIRTDRGYVYERCFDFGARLLAYFERNVAPEFMQEEKKADLQKTLEKIKKDKVDKTFGFIKAFDLSRQIEKRVQQPTQELWPF